MIKNILEAKKKIIVALDTKNVDRALNLVKKLPDAGAFKLGLEYFCANGPEGVKVISETGVKIFLDLKFHDIPNTVNESLKAVIPMQPFMLTLHISGGKNMIKAAVDTIEKDSKRNKLKRPLILGVTVLTSINAEDFNSLGILGNVEEQVVRMAELAHDSGLDGIVCSAKELKILKKHFKEKLMFITPGIRPNWGKNNDQKRIVTPFEALNFGADYLLIGRPITEAPEPKNAFDKICSEIYEE